MELFAVYWSSWTGFVPMAAYPAGTAISGQEFRVRVSAEFPAAHTSRYL